MAILTFAAPVSGLRGKVGGLVYSANKGGAYLKAWAKGSNPKTATQTAHRAILSSFSQNWQNITAAQRTAWDVYAALAAQDKTNSLGETYSVSGFAWYVALSTNLVNAGLSAIDSAPVLGTPGTPIIESVLLRTTDSGLSTAVRLTAGSPGLTDSIPAYISLFYSQARLVGQNQPPWMNTTIPDAGRRIFMKTESELKFGVIQLGNSAKFTVAIQSTEGRRGPEATALADATEV